MGTRGRQKFAGLAIFVAMLAACTAGSGAPVASDEEAVEPPVAQNSEEWCAAGADRAVDRLEAFLGQLPDVSAAEFVELDEVEGLAAFQNDIAQIIADTTNQSSTGCNLDGFQTLVGERINDVQRDGLLAEFLVNTIRDGRELTVADLAVSPGDDVEQVLGLLDDGSTLTFAPGVYALDRPLLIARSVTLIGESVESTSISSSSPDAAIVVVGRGELIMRDIAVEHTGDTVASVLLSFARPVDLRDVHLSGAVADEQGSAGNGLVLTDEMFGGAPAAESEAPRSVVAATTITANAGAGIATSGELQPQLEDLEVTNNGVCGICFFGASSGQLLNSMVSENDFGIQVGDSAAPHMAGNSVSANTTAGMVLLGTAAPLVELNSFSNNQAVALAVQESASPTILSNMFEGNLVGLSVISTGDVEVRDNDIVGGEIGL